MNPRAAASQLQQTAAPGMDVAHVMPHEVAQMKAQGAAVTRNPATGVVQMVMPQEKEVLRMNPAIANLVAGSGRNGDSQVAETSPGVRQQLKSRGGAGTRNPKTGKREYYTFDTADDSLSGAGVDPGTSGTTGTTGTTGTSTTPTGNDPSRTTPINIDTSTIASPVQDRTTGTATSGSSTGTTTGAGTVNATATPSTTPSVNATATPTTTTTTTPTVGTTTSPVSTVSTVSAGPSDAGYVNPDRVSPPHTFVPAGGVNGTDLDIAAPSTFGQADIDAAIRAYRDELGRAPDQGGINAQIQRAIREGYVNGSDQDVYSAIRNYISQSPESRDHQRELTLNAIRNLSSAQTAPGSQAQPTPQVVYQNGQPQIVYVTAPSTQGQNMIAGTATAPYNSLTPRRMARGRSSRYAGAPAMQFQV